MNGIKYILLLNVGETVCLTNSFEDRKTCELIDDGWTSLCSVSLLEQPWLHSGRKVIDNNCSSSNNNEVMREKREATGIKDIEDKSLIQELANIAVKTLDDLDANNLKRKVLEVQEAKKKVKISCSFCLFLVRITTLPIL